MATITIFIHGIGSNQDVWSKFINFMKQDESIKYIKEYHPNISIEPDGSYYYLYNYKSKKFNIPLKIKYLIEKLTGTEFSGNTSIEDHSTTFKSTLQSFSSTFEKINIVAHSMGGLVTMFALIDLINTPESESIQKCILFASPLFGSEEPEELSTLFGDQISTNILDELKIKSETINKLVFQINDVSDELRKNYKILYVHGDQDNRISKVRESFVEQFGKFAQVKGGHSEIIKPDNSNHSGFLIFKNHFFTEKTKMLQLDKTTNEKIIDNFIKNLGVIFPSSLLFNLPRLFQELNLNSTKHGDAKHITLEKKGNSLIYTDNGREFNPLNMNCGRNGFDTLQYILNEDPVKILYSYENGLNKLSLEFDQSNILENIDECKIELASHYSIYDLSDIRKNIATLIEEDCCDEIILDFSESKMCKSLQVVVVPNVIKEINDKKNGIKVVIQFDRNDKMMLSTFENTFKELFDLYDISVIAV